MFGLTLPQEYTSMQNDAALFVYVNRLFIVYSGGKYRHTTPDAEQAVSWADGLPDAAIYELNKDEQTSTRVY